MEQGLAAGEGDGVVEAGLRPRKANDRIGYVLEGERISRFFEVLGSGASFHTARRRLGTGRRRIAIGAVEVAADEAQEDLALAEEMPPAAEAEDSIEFAKAAPTLPPVTRAPVKLTAPLDSSDTSMPETLPVAGASEAVVKLVLEVRGPAAQVEAFLAAVRDKRIQAPPITLLVRDL